MKNVYKYVLYSIFLVIGFLTSLNSGRFIETYKMSSEVKALKREFVEKSRKIPIEIRNKDIKINNNENIEILLFDTEDKFLYKYEWLSYRDEDTWVDIDTIRGLDIHYGGILITNEEAKIRVVKKAILILDNLYYDYLNDKNKYL